MREQKGALDLSNVQVLSYTNKWKYSILTLCLCRWWFRWQQCLWHRPDDVLGCSAVTSSKGMSSEKVGEGGGFRDSTGKQRNAAESRLAYKYMAILQARSSATTMFPSAALIAHCELTEGAMEYQIAHRSSLFWLFTTGSENVLSRDYCMMDWAHNEAHFADRKLLPGWTCLALFPSLVHYYIFKLNLNYCFLLVRKRNLYKTGQYKKLI